MTLRRFEDHESTQDPIHDEERVLMDLGRWDGENAQKAMIEPSGQSISEVRLSFDVVSHSNRRPVTTA